MKQPFLSVIIPAYNEETRLPITLLKVVEFLHKQTYSSEILIVENGSQDQTFQVGLEFTRKIPNLRIIHLEESGKGHAIQQGIFQTTGTYRFIADADLSMPVEEINKFFPPSRSCEVNIASREAPGAIRYYEPVFRHITGRIYNLLIRLLLLPGLQDTQCGFKCFHGAIAEDIFRYQKLKGWAYDVEVLFIARRHGWKINEIPVRWYYSRDSKIKIVKDSIKMFIELLTIRRNAALGVYEKNNN